MAIDLDKEFDILKSLVNKPIRLKQIEYIFPKLSQEDKNKIVKEIDDESLSQRQKSKILFRFLLRSEYMGDIKRSKRKKWRV